MDSKTTDFYLRRKKDGFFDPGGDVSSEIYDENTKVIGKLIGQGTLEKQSVLKDQNGKTLLIIKKQLLSKNTYDILDSEGQKLGNVKGKKMVGDDLALYNSDKKMVLYEDNNFGNDVSAFKDDKENIVAAFAFVTQNLLTKKYPDSTICHLQIKDLSFDRLLILGFFLTWYSNNFDEAKVEDTGFESG